MASFTTLLTPRPLETCSGRLLLLPLLPDRKPFVLPSEIWENVFGHLVGVEGGHSTLWALLFMSKSFKDIVLPLIYTCVTILDEDTLAKFCKRVHDADAKWDSIRRIPYSAPARWVRSLDLSGLPFIGRGQALRVDGLLTGLFPLVPFLSHFSMSPAFTMSRRSLTSLTERPGISHLRSLSGISYVSSRQQPGSCMSTEPLLELLRNCVNLEELEIIGQNDPTDLDSTPIPGTDCQSCKPLHLPRLRTLTLLSMVHFSHVTYTLLISPFPALTKLTITPSDDIPESLNTRFITTHGASLRSLLLLSPKSWPTRLHPSPANILMTCPNLRHLSLENPMPQLILDREHSSLEILSITRPTPECWTLLTRLLRYLPSLKAVRARDVRWMRKGMGTVAQSTGLQGEMREWWRRLAKRGIRVLDMDWKDTE